MANQLRLNVIAFTTSKNISLEAQLHWQNRYPLNLDGAYVTTIKRYYIYPTTLLKHYFNYHIIFCRQNIAIQYIHNDTLTSLLTLMVLITDVSFSTLSERFAAFIRKSFRIPLIAKCLVNNIMNNTRVI